MLSRCKNCNYYFFEAEKDYICCSNCGQIIKENFPQQPLKRAAAYFEVTSYERYMKRAIISIKIILFLSIAFSLVSFYSITGLRARTLASIGRDLRLINALTVGVIMELVLFATTSKNMLYHKAMASSTFWWKYATSFSYRILKWILLAILIYLVMRYVTEPLMADTERFRRVATESSITRVKGVYYLNTLAAIPLIVSVDLIDYFRYRRARKLDKKRFM